MRKKILDKQSGGSSTPNLDRVRSALARLKTQNPPPEYDRYMRSKAWQSKRAETLDYYHHRCSLCGKKDDLQVHHLHYQTIGREKIEDLAICCRSCHFKLHLPDSSESETWAGTRAHRPPQRRRSPGK